MKRIIGYIGAWTLYYLGHLTYKCMNNFVNLYPIYKWAMNSSISIQDWAKLQSPWQHINKLNENEA